MKIIIEKKKNGIKVNVKKAPSKKDVVIILIKTLINTSRAMNINLYETLDELTEEISNKESKE